MRFVAGSHRRHLVPHRESPSEENLLSRGQEITVEVDENEATDILLEPASVHFTMDCCFPCVGPEHVG